MKLGDFLSSINQTKTNLCRGDEAATKHYPMFICNRLLSYHMECIEIVNELNVRGNQFHEIDNLAGYEFLLHMIPKGKRFAKMAKEDDDEVIKAIMYLYNYSRQKAQDCVGLFDDEATRQLLEKMQRGGKK